MIVYKNGLLLSRLNRVNKTVADRSVSFGVHKGQTEIEKIYFILSFGIVYDLDSVENEKPYC